MPVSGFDPNFKPRFLPEIVAVPFQGGVVVDGTSRLQIFEGKASEGLLPTLIKLMDGSRTVKELAVAIPGVRAEAISKAISLLVRCGLLTDGRSPTNEEDPILNLDTLSFFRRCLHARHAPVSSELAYENLRTAEVAVVESSSVGHHSEILRSALAKAGMTRISSLGRQSLSDWGQQVLGSSPRPLLVSLSLGREDCAWHAELDDWCAKHQLRWLRSALDRSRNLADLGPLFDGKINPCFRCFAAMHGNPEYLEDSHRDILRTDLFSWSGLLASEIIYLVSGLGPLATGAEFQRYDLSRWTARSLRWARIPRCPRCRPLTAEGKSNDTPSPQCVDTAVVFEDYVGIQSLALSAQKGAIDPQAYRTLALPTNQMSHCKQIRLGREVPKIERSILYHLDKDAVGSGEPIKIDELGTLLLLTGGIRRLPREGTSPRWAATAGNLGSVELFIVAHRVQGLTAGFYRYQPGEHALAHFQRSSGGISTEEFIRRAIPNESVSPPQVLVVFVGAYSRVAQKYDEFAYRLINLDAGAALSQLDLAARTFDISCHIANRWADDLAEEQLNLDPGEHCTGIVRLCRNGIEHIQEDYPPESRLTVATGTFSKAPRAFSEKSVRQVMEILHHESRVLESEVAVSPSAVPAALINNNDSNVGSPLTDLPSPARGGRLLGDILACRKSIRQYTPEPVSLEQMSTMLNCAYEADRTHWPTEHVAGLSLTFLILAFRVAGLERGVYTYEPQRHGVYFSKAAPSSKNASALFVQSEFADAPLVLWIAGNLGAAVARNGGFGHRQLLLRAGAAAHRLWMAAMATGLSGCIVAGVVPGAAREQLGLDGYKQASLLALAVGAAGLT